MVKDVQGNYRRIFFEELKKVYGENGEFESFFVDAIESIQDLVVYYSFLFEEVLALDGLEDRIYKLSELLERAAWKDGKKNGSVRNSVVAENLAEENTRYLFKVKMDKEGKIVGEDKNVDANSVRTMYILQSISAFLPLVSELSIDEDFEISREDVNHLKALYAQLQTLRDKRKKINEDNGTVRGQSYSAQPLPALRLRQTSW